MKNIISTVYWSHALFSPVGEFVHGDALKKNEIRKYQHIVPASKVLIAIIVGYTDVDAYRNLENAGTRTMINLIES